MPVDPKLYPPDWPLISARIIAVRAGNRCECMGECGLHQGRRCVEVNHHHAWNFRGVVHLACAHTCQDGPQCTKDGHLRAMCQRCHVRFDAEMHWNHRKMSPPKP